MHTSIQILNAFEYTKNKFMNISCKKKLALLFSIVFTVRVYKYGCRLYDKWYAKKLDEYFDSISKKETDLDLVKRRFLSDKLQANKNGKILRIVEIGYCGSNFEYYPSGTSLTLCNYLKDYDVYLFERIKKYAKHIWLYHDNISMSLFEFRDDSVDIVYCSHFMCSFKETNHLIEEIYRVLKPGGKFIYIEHICSDSILIRLAQYLVNPVWSAFNNGCSLTKPIIDQMESFRFKIVDQTICSINLIESKSFLGNMLLRRHVLGYAIK